MKKLIIAAAVLSAGFTWAADAAKDGKKEDKVTAESAAELEEKDDAPIFFGYADYGIYSGYQLYGNLVNSEPTMQSYAEINANLPWDLGYAGLGLWHNSDLTGKRGATLRRAFNEFDPKAQWGRFFAFTDDGSWGIDFRTWVVWYIYPNTGNRPNTNTSFDWDYSFSLKNPYVTPFLTIVHEYKLSKGTLLEFGAKRECRFFDGVPLTITPMAAFVYRDENYNWCFPTHGFTECGGNWGIATMRLQLDATYMLTDNFGLFAKVAFCSLIDDDLRDIAERSSGADYSKYKDFAWGGLGAFFVF